LASFILGPDVRNISAILQKVKRLERGWKGNAGKERMEKPLSGYNHSRLEGSITAPGRERRA